MFGTIRLKNCCWSSIDEVVRLDRVFIYHVFIVTQILYVFGLHNMGLLACSVANLMSVAVLSVGFNYFFTFYLVAQSTLVLNTIISYFSYCILRLSKSRRSLLSVGSHCSLLRLHI